MSDAQIAAAAERVSLARQKLQKVQERNHDELTVEDRVNLDAAIAAAFEEVRLAQHALDTLTPSDIHTSGKNK
jgi:hypothetical protein